MLTLPSTPQALHAEGVLHRDVSLLTVELDDPSSFDTARCVAG